MPKLEVLRDTPQPTENVGEIKLWQKIANLEPDRNLDPDTTLLKIQHLAMFLRQNVTVEDFLADRLAQANLDVILHNSPENIYPPVRYQLAPPHKGGGQEPTTFLLKEDQHIYFFDIAWPIKNRAIRTQDIVKFEDYSWNKFPKHKGMAPGTDFTKSPQRTTFTGGDIEFYNYRLKKWIKKQEVISRPIMASDVMKFGISEPDFTANLDVAFLKNRLDELTYREGELSRYRTEIQSILTQTETELTDIDAEIQQTKNRLNLKEKENKS